MSLPRDSGGLIPESLPPWEILKSSVRVPDQYMVSKLFLNTLPKLLAAAPASDRARLQSNYNKVASTANGSYALIDYVNFKGDGTKTSERYNGKGWGLLQVLGNMKEVSSGRPAAAEFSASAKRMLDRRITNSPPARGESRWREGWHNRCNTYARPL